MYVTIHSRLLTVYLAYSYLFSLSPAMLASKTNPVGVELFFIETIFITTFAYNSLFFLESANFSDL